MGKAKETSKHDLVGGSLCQKKVLPKGGGDSTRKVLRGAQNLLLEGCGCKVKERNKRMARGQNPHQQP